ncbi:hypothetical protein Sango_0995700 [Sesamum angolense]|uniref:Uncharacterized protein n=1 Tax=Sesamum angolense TaxID=2727404 RepID=A0AAE1WZI1_9LAMI|nr:hypothetical protein Sango_0995700 [Sesamum angolense]
MREKDNDGPISSLLPPHLLRAYSAGGWHESRPAPPQRGHNQAGKVRRRGQDLRPTHQSLGANGGVPEAHGLPLRLLLHRPENPLSLHHDRLQPGHNYFLLPANFFQSALSFTTFIRCRSAFAGRPPFEVEKTPSGSLRIKVTDEMIVQHQEEEEVEAAAAQKMIRVCSTPQLRKEYEQLVGRRHHWKPKLDTIAEKKSSHQKKKTRKKKSAAPL